MPAAEVDVGGRFRPSAWKATVSRRGSRSPGRDRACDADRGRVTDRHSSRFGRWVSAGFAGRRDEGAQGSEGDNNEREKWE